MSSPSRTTGEREARIAEIEDDIRELAEKRQAHVEAAESYSETAAKQADEYMRSFYEERASRHNVRAAFWGRIMSRLSELSSARKDAERYNALAKHYVAADFNYPQYEGYSALIFALPKGTKVSSYLNGTIDAASRSEETGDV